MKAGSLGQNVTSVEMFLTRKTSRSVSAPTGRRIMSSPLASFSTTTGLKRSTLRGVNSRSPSFTVLLMRTRRGAGTGSSFDGIQSNETLRRSAFSYWPYTSGMAWNGWSASAAGWE